MLSCLAKRSMITENYENQVGIKEELKSGNRADFSIQHLMKSQLLSWSTKARIYCTILIPMVMYGVGDGCKTRGTSQLV